MSWKFRFQNFWYLHFGFLYPHNKKLHYRYVIVSPTYNVKPYIEDFYRSIVWQSGSFKKSIHIVTVDDGSTDGTAEIAKKWQRRYPQNIIYLYRKNGGLPVARNTGLKYVFTNIKADFVTFTDPDDFVDRNYFRHVDQAITKLACAQERNIGYVACKIVLWREKSRRYVGDHLLDFKFSIRTESITVESRKNMQLSSASSFFPLESVRSLNIFFNAAISVFEDAVWISRRILRLSRSQKQILVPSALYFYRKRKVKDSLMDAELCRESYFLGIPKVSLQLMKERTLSDEKCKWTRFLDRVVIYHFLWYFRNGAIERVDLLHPQNILDESLSRVRKVFHYVDFREMNRCDLPRFWMLDKVRMLSLGKGEEIQHTPTLYVQNIDARKSGMILLAYIKDDANFEIFLDGERVSPLFFKKTPLRCWTRIWGYEVRFVIPFLQDKAQVLTAKIRGIQCNLFDRFLCEHSAQLSIRSACLARAQRSSKENQGDFWLFIDRDMQADDNAEHLYRYVRDSYPKQNIKFMIRRTSPHWKRLKKDGFNLVGFDCRPSGPLGRASKIISSQLDLPGSLGVGPFQFKDFVFLQHGVSQHDMSNWLNKHKIDLMITATPMEHFLFLEKEGNYGFLPFQVKMTGFPRHDNLLQKARLCNRYREHKSIIIAPAWRIDLVGEPRVLCNGRLYNKAFYNSDYAIAWGSFLKSKILRSIALRYGYHVVFFPHPNIGPYVKRWDLPNYIMRYSYAEGNKSIQDVLVESDLMITDFSSIAFEMAYLRKSIIYYQFDEDLFFQRHCWRKGYWDYRRDGFGPVVTTEEALLEELDKLLKNNCRMKSQYLHRMKVSFPFRDGLCCKRVHDAICCLDKPRHQTTSIVNS
ncbi:MAG: CDP-glycerol:glycerophosphate glycerophosphotransferase [Holosporaceae bacterium]|jgi:glycosyltransferase involved in cell wall biosynthesis|nr:CDP-glycerol:glycerophosphate glycerophosphotransferase [Holosporaceae bacterium]